MSEDMETDEEKKTQSNSKGGSKTSKQQNRKGMLWKRLAERIKVKRIKKKKTTKHSQQISIFKVE